MRPVGRSSAVEVLDLFATCPDRPTNVALLRLGCAPVVTIFLILLASAPASAQTTDPSQHLARVNGEGDQRQATATPDELWAHAARLLRERKDREALEPLSAIIELDSQDGPALRERALARWREFLRPMPFSTDPSVSNFGAFRGELCRYTNEPCVAVTQVLDDLDRAIALFHGPARAVALSDRAAILADRGEAGRAQADLDEAARVRDSGDLRSQRASVRLKLGDVPGAMSDLDVALAERDDAGDRLSRAELRRSTGDKRGARADVEAGLAIPQQGGHASWAYELAALRRTLVVRGESQPAKVVTLRVIRTTLLQDAEERVRISFNLDRSSAERLYKFTDFHLGGVVELAANGRVLLSTRILEPIRHGTMMITSASDGAEGRREALSFVRGLGRSRLRLRVLD